MHLHFYLQILYGMLANYVALPQNTSPPHLHTIYLAVEFFIPFLEDHFYYCLHEAEIQETHFIHVPFRLE